MRLTWVIKRLDKMCLRLKNHNPTARRRPKTRPLHPVVLSSRGVVNSKSHRVELTVTGAIGWWMTLYFVYMASISACNLLSSPPFSYIQSSHVISGVIIPGIHLCITTNINAHLVVIFLFCCSNFNTGIRGYIYEASNTYSSKQLFTL